MIDMKLIILRTQTTIQKKKRTLTNRLINDEVIVSTVYILENKNLEFA